MPRRTAQPAAPRVSPPDLPVVFEEVHSLQRHADVQGARISGLSGTVDAAHASLIECVITASVDRLDLSGAAVTDARFDGLSAAEVVARDARWRTVELVGGRVGTLDLLRAELDVVVFREVRIDYLSLPSARVLDVRFEGCRIGTLDIPQATLTRVAFADCQVDEVDTRELRARDLDLRGLEALGFTDPTGLRGATLDVRQAEMHAASFAAALGIDVAGA
ncbi:pentapeptide repeat-containing protein [Microbacterium invictum]|uniref:Pentapeptide repeat-containing protein n=1 Tax=Microbacterium invictum TaxID=515415 RepID=A0AA40VL32_9MICO|nr:hypothetical protein [Microbacterium invictum]MBB4139034.1 hypothetical protein [Microbacterium invictum]